MDWYVWGVVVDKLVLCWLGWDGVVFDFSYVWLVELMGCFVNVLMVLGMVVGDGVFLLCGCVLEFYVVLLGVFKLCCVVMLLFFVFGFEFIVMWLMLGVGKLFVMMSLLYWCKIELMCE